MIRVDVVLTSEQGSPWYSSLHFNNESAAGEQAAVDAVAVFWGALDATMSDSVDWETLPEVPTIDPLTGQTTSVATTTQANGAGSVAGETVGYALQALIRWQTGVFVNGRQLRGRTFVPGLGTGNQSDGRVGAPTVVALAAAGQALVDGMPAGQELVVYSPTHRQLADVNTATCWNQWAIMRSRRD